MNTMLNVYFLILSSTFSTFMG